MSNNPLLFDAVLSGAAGGSSERWIQSSQQSVYAGLADSAEALATAVDALIPTIGGGATQQQADVLQSIVQGVVANRLIKSTTVSDYADVAGAIAAAFNAVDAKLEAVAPTPPTPTFEGVVTTSSFVQSAKYTGTVSVPMTSTEGLSINLPLEINGNLYAIASVDDATHLTLINTGVDNNQAPLDIVPTDSPVLLAHGALWTMSFFSAGVIAAKLPICASPRFRMDVRYSSCGGAGGGGGGPGFNAATTGGGGSGGRGGGAGGPCITYNYGYNGTPGETLTVTVGAAGIGGTGGTAGNPGQQGGAAGDTSVVGSTSGSFIATPNIATFMRGGAGPAGLTGAVTAGGASPAAGTGVNGSGTVASGAAGAPGASGAGGAATAGANGAATTNKGQLLYLRPGVSIGTNGALGAAGGTGNAVNRGGGGAGGDGGGGGIGDTFPINGVTMQLTDGVGGTSGHGGAADTNAGLTPGGNGANGVNGQGGAGGGGGGGGGSAVGSALPGAAGGNGGNGSVGLVVVYGSML